MEHEEIRSALRENGAEVVRFVDVSGLSPEQNRGFPRAVLLGMSLSKGFVLDMRRGRPTERDEYLEAERAVEELADRLAEQIRERGRKALSQSEKYLMEEGCADGGFADPALRVPMSPLPQKTLARLAGLGFIGKNNLLVTEEYGCALALCSVLTDAPLPTENRTPVASRCGDCHECVAACAPGALRGSPWTRAGGREALVDISKCRCALACMTACPWTLRYAGGEEFFT